MRFSNVCDYKGEAHYIVKTGRKNIRILKPGLPYEKSFVVPLKKVSNRRPAEYEEEPEDETEDQGGEAFLNDVSDLLEDGPAANEEVEDEQFLPQ